MLAKFSDFNISGYALTPGLKKIMIFIKKIGFLKFKSDLFDFFEIWYIDIYIDV